MLNQTHRIQLKPIKMTESIEVNRSQWKPIKTNQLKKCKSSIEFAVWSITSIIRSITSIEFDQFVGSTIETFDWHPLGLPNKWNLIECNLTIGITQPNRTVIKPRNFSKVWLVQLMFDVFNLQFCSQIVFEAHDQLFC